MESSRIASDRSEKPVEMKKGPWTAEEDSILINSIAIHGEGRWNSLARFAGLKRTGKSCRLRWLNYLRPDVHRGNITLQEQLLILQLHCRWGNRWSKIAQELPGRTDNEIKNYWRTRVQKHAKQLNCDVNSKKFRDAMKNEWIPRLVEKIRSTENSMTRPISGDGYIDQTCQSVDRNLTPEISAGSSETQISIVSDLRVDDWPEDLLAEMSFLPDEFSGSSDWCGDGLGCGLDFQLPEPINGSGTVENMWSEENLWFLRQQLMN